MLLMFGGLACHELRRCSVPMHRARSSAMGKEKLIRREDDFSFRILNAGTSCAATTCSEKGE